MLPEFIIAIENSLEQNHFIKITLSKTTGKAVDLKNIYIRPISLKGDDFLSFTYRYANQDIIKNYPIKEALARLEQYLGQNFLMATLFTTAGDVVLEYNKKREAKIQRNKPSIKELPTTEHNQAKNYHVAEDSLFLEKLGIASQGKVQKAHQDKYRQINKYVEIMEGLLRQISLPEQAHIVDMGCGKGYLTFALYDFLLQQTPKKSYHITGIELREQLTNFCNVQAKALNWKELDFVAQDIMNYDNNKIDVLIALHACDIATDIAIAKGIQANAQLIVTAPCCHKQIRKAMQQKNPLQSILKHGILEERQAEILTDGIRALILEAHGYQTKVFEFISLEHTAKNLMITAVKQKNAPKEPSAQLLKEVQHIKEQFGIKEHYLELIIDNR